ncbi:HD-GYP domain-containing protein [Virgibacillus sp. W0181]|uniref:HD-GYP domain-containing protein n=1 Tax=Virgibacillus sp. W0181 TaxID=3391581 RepID=UPI003F487844
MQVKTSQLIPSCILLKDVIGPSSRPIVPKNTVLTEQHIKVLHKFLIKTAHVSSKLANGEVFTPDDVIEIKEAEKSPKKVEGNSALEHYLFAVQEFKDNFHHWQNNLPIDMPAIRKIMVPLLNRLDELGSAVFRLQHYSTKADYVYHHCVAVSLLSAYIGKKMNLPKNECIQIGLAGLLSDSGMAKINNYYQEDRSLTEQEYAEIKNHPVYSFRLVEKIPTLSTQAKLAILQHHEKYDGSGYPHGLKADKIHVYAQIIAVCDIYHAMTSERVYKGKKSSFQVIEQLQRKQFSKLDPKVVLLFIENLTNLTVGTPVKLSDHRQGEIVFINQKQPTRPMVQLADNKEIIMLEKEKDIYIEEVLEE